MGICVLTSGCRELGHSAKPRVVVSVTGWEVSPALGRDSTFGGLAAASLS